MISLAIIGLYAWNVFSKSTDITASLLINLPAVILAGVTALVCLISYIWNPKKLIFPVSLTIYMMLAASIAVIILTTGGSASPFIVLWMLTGIFAGIFNAWGVLPIFIATSVFFAWQYINGSLTDITIVVVILSSILPMLTSVIIWHEKSATDENDNEDKAYRNLANKLTEVASESEVVINAIGDGVIAIDNQGVIQLINPAAQVIIGWGKQDAIALNYKSVLKLVNKKDEALDAANDPIQQVLNTNQQIRTNDLTLMTSSDKKLMISLVVSPVGEVGSGVIAVFHDITKEKSEEREQAEFISTASHEMRTPVASIEGYLGLALNPQTAQVDDRARDFILKAHASAQHLGHLFQDLLDVSKADDGRISNNPKVVNLVTFAHDIVQGLSQKAIDKGLRLIYVPMPDDSNVKFIAPEYSVNLDNDHIREIIDNLVENAIKYTPKGDVTVDVTGDDEHVILSVKDSGIGIPAEDMPHLFQKFYRVDNKDTREIGGTGLGLYLSRRLAEIMGGRIWAESVYGTGSTFYVELPRVSSQEASLLAEKQSVADQQETAEINNQPTKINVESGDTPQQTTIVAPEQAKTPNNVPRGQALTPEQIADYVAKQRALVAEQQTSGMPAATVSSNSRPQFITVPTRDIQQPTR